MLRLAGKTRNAISVTTPQLSRPNNVGRACTFFCRLCNVKLAQFSSSNGNGGTTKGEIKDYFQVLNIERSFTLSLSQLKATYKSLMNEVHPDRYATAPIDEQTKVANKAAIVTRGYEVLNDDYERATHLLELEGCAMEDNVSGDVVGNETLLFIMELREEIDLTSCEETLRTLQDQNHERIQETCREIRGAFEKGDLDNAKQWTAKLKYWNRVDEEIRSKIDD